MTCERARDPVPEPASFTAFVLLHRPHIVAVLNSTSNTHRDVEDAVQEALLILRHHWHEVCRYDRPEAWLAKVALRLLSRTARRDRLQAHAPSHEPVDDSGVRSYEEVERTTDIASVMAGPPPAQREVVALHYRLDLSVTDIAGALCIPAGTVRCRLSRARATIAARWIDEEDPR